MSLYKSKLFLLVFLILLTTSSHAAWRASTQSGDWSNTATWGGLSVPANGDQVSIGAGHTVNYYGDLSKTAGQLEINGGRLNIVGNLTLGSSVLSGTTAAGGQLFVYGNYTQQSNFQINGGATVVVMNNMTASGIINVNNGLLVVNGNLIKSNTVTVDSNSNIVVAGNYTSNAGDTWINSGNAFVFNTITCSGSNCNLIKNFTDWNSMSSPGQTFITNGSIDFFSPGTFSFTVPEGVTRITVQAWGGGGGSGGHSAYGDAPTNGGNGQATTFSTISAQGGIGSNGTMVNGTTTAGGSGGIASGGNTNTTGSNGAIGTRGSVSLGGNGGASPNGGATRIGPSISGQNNSVSGLDGNFPGGGAAGSARSANQDKNACSTGGGGGGAYSSLSSLTVTPGQTIPFTVGAGGTAGTGVSGNGGAGANGQIIISWSSCAVPTAPTANAGSNASCTQITANWSASSGATSYRLDVSTVSNFATFIAGYNDLNVGSVTSYIVTGLTGSTTYYYRVRAVNSCSTSGNSGTITYATTPAASVASVTGTSPLCAGSTATYSANSVVLSGGAGSWSSSNTSVATVNSSTGLVTAVGAGSCNIIYTITGGCGGTVSSSQSVTVNALPSPPTTTDDQICIGSTAILSATGATSGQVYKWYDAAIGGSLLKTSTSNTDNTYTTPVVSATTNYWVSLSADGCESTRTQATATFPAVSTENQHLSGSDVWVGHVYDGNAFDSYYGIIPGIQSETINQNFGGSTVCFDLVSGTNTRSIYTEYFSVRYRMTTSRTGIFLIDLRADDGIRLSVNDGSSWVFNRWVPQSPTTYPNVLLPLNTGDKLVYEYFENGVDNEVSFQYLRKVPNSLTSGLTQNVCLGSPLNEIVGNNAKTDAPISDEASFTVSYQWEQSPNGTSSWTNIAGANSTNYTPTELSAGTHYFRRKLTVQKNNPGIPDNTFISVTAIDYSNVATIQVTPANTASTPSSTPTLCINTALTNITHTITGATGIGTPTGLPAGVSAAWSSGTITISGTPSASGTFNYNIPLTGGCGNVNATGTITVTPGNTVSSASSTPTLCINTALTNITHTTTGATGIGTPIGLPAGVSAAWAGGTITISGTPTVSGTFNYSIPLTGGCGNVNATGTITVTPANTVGEASSTPTLCINTALTNITHTTTGATDIGSPSGLPAGVTATWASDQITISGTPTEAGTFNYSIPLTGGCGNITATGSINVTPNNTINLTSAVGTNAQTTCINTAIANITYSTTGATGIGAATGLPTGVSAAWAGGTITISGTPTASGTFNYNIPLTGGCGIVNATGTITVTPASVAGTATSALAQVCTNTGTTLTLSGYIGSIQWQTNSSGSWQNIPGATAETYNTPNLTTSTSFRAVVTNGICSNATSNEVTITLDQVLPTFSNCPANKPVNVDQGLCSAIVEWDIPTATDNCGTPTVAVIANESITTIGGKHRATIAVGTSTIKYTATDNNGNLQTCTFTITVTDNISPQITCPPGQSVFCAENAPIYTNLAEFTAAGGTATDNCSLNAGSFTRLTDVSNGNALTRTYRISDAAGNSSSCEQVFTISQPSVSIQSQNTTTCIGGTFSITSTISSGFGAVNYQWQKRANSTSPWNNIAGATSSQLDGTLGSFQEEYRLLVSQTTGFSGACSPASDPLTFSDTQAPVFSGYAPQNQILCTAPGATTAAASGMSIQEIDVIDNCTLNLSTGLSYTITGVGATGVSATGNNLPENPQFNVGTSTVTYTVSDTYGNVGTHTVTIVVQAAPAPITIAYSSGGNQPTQCSGYTYSVDGGVTQPGYTYEWNVLSGATPVTSGFSGTNAGTASVSITWTGDLPAGNYTLEATKRAANDCESKATLAIALQNNFDLKVEPAGQDCKGEFPPDTEKTITWEVTRLCGTSSWGFTYYLFYGQLTSLPANHQSINIGKGTFSNETAPSKIFDTIVKYGTEPYTQTVFTLFIVNGSDSNSGNDYNYFYLKGIPNTSPISTD